MLRTSEDVTQFVHTRCEVSAAKEIDTGTLDVVIGEPTIQAFDILSRSKAGVAFLNAT
jgi:hypothetical protein